MDDRTSARWHLAASLLCYLVCSPLLTYFVTPYALGGVLLVYPLYTVTWAWGRKSGLAAAAIGVGINSVVWLVAGNGRHTMSEIGLGMTVALFVFECFSSSAFVFVVSSVRRRADQGRAELERSRDLLHHSEMKYRKLIEAAPAAISVVVEGRVAFCNSGLLDMLGFSREEMIGKEIADLIHKDDVNAAMERHAARTEGNIIPKVVNRNVRKDGAAINVESVGMPIEWEGRPAILYFATDATERIRLQEQSAHAQKMEAIGRLSGGIAHDFNNLLQVILGFCSLIKSRPNDPGSVLSDTRVIEDSARKAASLTQQLLAFSRKQMVQARVFDVRELGSQFEGVLGRLLGEDVALAVVQGTEESRVRADPDQIQQVIMNLALNAKDAMPRGGRLTISIDVDRVADGFLGEIPPGGYVRITVADTGQGMDDATMDHLFEPFFTTKEVGKGTGLGLSIVYGIVKQSGGYITAESCIGTGSTFIIHLPRVLGPLGNRDECAEEESQHGTGSILLVEDEPAVRGLVRRILECGGYTVEDAESGEKALEMCRAHADGFDLLLTDIVLAGMRGGDVADHVRRIFPGIRVIFMSGYAGTTEVPHRDYAPMLRKPFSTADLLGLVKRALSAARG
jgi:two-component system, cell cycle sensor histidine kinase and response regulator CckA